ncbi:MAG TPA: type II secretion system protein GspC [Polyangiaceae bacterium]|jgi:general secretion pathway protein C
MPARSLVPVVLGTLALCGWLHAQGLSALAGASLGTPRLRHFSLDPPPPAPPRPRDGDVILARNAFDSETGSLLDRGGVCAAPSAPLLADAVPASLPACDGVRLVSIVASEDPSWSFAMLDVRGEKEPLLYRRGSELLAIGRDRVLVDHGGTRCVARMFASPSVVVPPVAPATLAKGIVPTGPGAFAVDRAVRDALFDGATDLMRSIAIRPEKRGDEVVGIRLAVLKPGTPLDALGVRASDVLLSMNGVALTSPEQMFSAYARARTEPHLTVVLQRDGRPMQLDFDVR